MTTPGMIDENTSTLYRKKPVVVKAWQWLGQSKEARPGWLNESGAYLTYDKLLIIPTLEGEMIADPKDWIIQGVKGECYPCKPDIFEATYDKV